MKVGDLVKWREVTGIVVATRSSERHDKPDHYLKNSSYIHWSDGDSCWMSDVALEVISESQSR